MKDRSIKIDHYQLAKRLDCHLATAYRITKRPDFPKGVKTAYLSRELFKLKEVNAYLKANPDVLNISSKRRKAVQS